MFDEVPPEVLRSILLRMSDQRSLHACLRLNQAFLQATLPQDYFWRELTRQHYPHYFPLAHAATENANIHEERQLGPSYLQWKKVYASQKQTEAAWHSGHFLTRTLHDQHDSDGGSEKRADGMFVSLEGMSGISMACRATSATLHRHLHDKCINNGGDLSRQSKEDLHSAHINHLTAIKQVKINNMDDDKDVLVLMGDAVGRVMLWDKRLVAVVANDNFAGREEVGCLEVQINRSKQTVLSLHVWVGRESGRVDYIRFVKHTDAWTTAKPIVVKEANGKATSSLLAVAINASFSWLFVSHFDNDGYVHLYQADLPHGQHSLQEEIAVGAGQAIYYCMHAIRHDDGSLSVFLGTSSGFLHKLKFKLSVNSNKGHHPLLLDESCSWTKRLFDRSGLVCVTSIALGRGKNILVLGTACGRVLGVNSADGKLLWMKDEDRGRIIWCLSHAPHLNTLSTSCIGGPLRIRHLRQT